MPTRPSTTVSAALVILLLALVNFASGKSVTPAATTSLLLGMEWLNELFLSAVLLFTLTRAKTLFARPALLPVHNDERRR